VSTEERHPSPLEELPIPVSFRCLDPGTAAIDYATQVFRIFQNGFVITSPRKLRIGSLLSLRLRIPLELEDGVLRELRCPGRVVAEEARNGGELQYRVEVENATLPV